ncbi:hypothetical protein [Methylomagnum sp.]
MALQKTLAKDFDVNQALSEENLKISQFGTVYDEYTGLCHNHELISVNSLPQEIKDGGFNDNGIPLALLKGDDISKVKGRLNHAYENLEKLKSCDKKIGFVRWRKVRYLDHELTDTFQDESITGLANILSAFLGHEHFSILSVVASATTDPFPVEDIMVSYNPEQFGIAAVIKERRGFNGDGTKDYRGDTISWNYLLSKYISEENISLD